MVGSEVVHLYIAGDGRPFVQRNHVARDPSVREPLVLKLMRRDEAPAILLGRPCYHGLAADADCDPRWWTQARYSENVVRSMVRAANAVLEGRPVRLIGHSGGGTIAVLMAARMANVVGIVTIGANLDVGAWVESHGYTPLDASINPMAVFSELADIPQLHLWGEADDTVRPASQIRAIPLLPDGSACLVPRFDHHCCWARDWNNLLTNPVCDAFAGGRIVGQ